MLKLIRDGDRTVADLMSFGKKILGRRHVMPSVCSTLKEIQVEGTFRTGTYLVTVHSPIASEDGDIKNALYGSFLPIPDPEVHKIQSPEKYEDSKRPGVVVPSKTAAKIVLNRGRKRQQVQVTSRGDRPVQV